MKVLFFCGLTTLVLVSFTGAGSPTQKPQPATKPPSATTPTSTTKPTTQASATSAKPPTIPAQAGSSSTSNSTGNSSTTVDPFSGLTLSKVCRPTVTACLGQKTLANAKCADVESQKTCFKKKCTDAEYKNMEDEKCFCPRTVANVVLICILCALSKLFVKQ